MSARLFVGEHRGPDLVRIEVVARCIDQRIRIGLEHARNETFAHQLALAIASVRIESIANHRLAIADHVRDHGDQAQRHLAEIDVRVTNG